MMLKTKETYVPVYRPYRNEDKLVEVVLVNELNLMKFNELNFIESPENRNCFAEFKTRKEAIEWVNAHFEKDKIEPSIRLKPITLPEDNVVYRPYVNDYALVTVAKIERDSFQDFVFSRFFRDEEERYIEFKSEGEAIDWIYQRIETKLIDPNYRIFKLEDYFKYTCRPDKRGTSKRSYSSKKR